MQNYTTLHGLSMQNLQTNFREREPLRTVFQVTAGRTAIEAQCLPNLPLVKIVDTEIQTTTCSATLSFERTMNSLELSDCCVRQFVVKQARPPPCCRALTATHSPCEHTGEADLLALLPTLRETSSECFDWLTHKIDPFHTVLIFHVASPSRYTPQYAQFSSTHNNTFRPNSHPQLSPPVRQVHARGWRHQ